MMISDYCAVQDLAITATGTSEGAEKGWDTRGRHPEAGKFELAEHGSYSPSRYSKTYRTANSVVSVNEPKSGRGSATVREYAGEEVNHTGTFRGPVKGLAGFLSNRYSIEHSPQNAGK